MERLPALSTAQIDTFYARGYVLVAEVFSAGELAVLRAAFDRLRRMADGLRESCLHRGARFVVEPGATRTRIHRVVWCGAADRVLSTYGKDARLLALAGQLLGSDCMQQLINQAHFKLPGDGVAFPWHQDSRHRRYGTDEWRDVNGHGSYVQTILALDEVTAQNGPLRVIPYSNRLGHVDVEGNGALPPPLDAADAVTVTQAPGSVLLLGPYTFHCSEPNHSDRPRRLFINGFACPGANTRVYPGRGAGRLVWSRQHAAAG